MDLPPHPEPRDPRSRRWTILLVLLALVVAAGVGLRVADDRRSSGDDRASDRSARADDAGDSADREDDAEPAERADEAEPAEPADDPDAQDPAAGDPLGVVLAATTDVNGNPAMVVEQLGPVLLGAGSTLPAVTRMLGEPDSSGPDPQMADVCAATWVEYGLEAHFYFGHPPSSEASCAKGPVAAAVMTGERWFIRALTGGEGATVLDVGDPVADIATAFPLAERTALSPGLEQLTGTDRGWLLAEGSYGGDPYPTLYAIEADGVVASFVYVSGAD